MNAKNSSAARLLSIDELDRDIVTLTDRLNAGTFDLLVLIRQFDERAVPSCGYRAQDMIDNTVGDGIHEISKAINNPSAEGFFTAMETSVVSSAPP